MKPKTKLQKQIAGLIRKLPGVTSTQENWVRENFFEHQAYKTKGELTCFECGHKWKDPHSLLTSIDGCVCPNCGRKLKVRLDKKRVIKDSGYFCIVTTFQGFQVLRFFNIEVYLRVGKPAYYAMTEVVQNWITSDGKEIVAARCTSMSMYYDQWVYGSDLELRADTNLLKYRINPWKMYPVKRVIDNVKRNGFKGDFHNIAPVDFITMILKDKKAETLLKSGQSDMLKHYRHLYSGVEKFWPSIRICIRNGYQIKDASMWCDYINCLIYFKKDIHNAKYVCPVDLKAAHDKFSEKRRIILERERLEKKKKKAMEDEKVFIEEKRRFFGLCISDDLIKIIVLDSINEFIKEGETLHHCVFTGSYYSMENSLILSARLEEKRIETIEVDLKKMDIVQSRGLLNGSSEYHDRIVDLVKNNMNVIKRFKNKRPQGQLISA